MKKILISVIFSLFVLVGGIFFVSRNFSNAHILEKGFVVVKASGENMYQYSYPFLKGERLIDIVKQLENQNLSIEEIYVMKKRKWTVSSPDEKINWDVSIKVKFTST